MHVHEARTEANFPNHLGDLPIVSPGIMERGTSKCARHMTMNGLEAKVKSFIQCRSVRKIEKIKLTKTFGLVCFSCYPRNFRFLKYKNQKIVVQLGFVMY